MIALSRVGERTLGLVGVIAVVVAALMVAVISFVPFGQHHYSAVLEHSAGLRAGEEVQIAGVGVGDVRGIRLEDHHVVVDFTVDDGVRLGRSSTAAVKVATLLGSHFLEIDPDGPGSLKDDTIALDRTTVPFNLQDVIEGSTGALDRIDGEAVAASMQVVAEALRGTPQAARDAIDGVARLSAVASKRTDQMQELLRASRTVTGDLAASSADIIDLLRQSTLILEELTRRRDVIHQMLLDARRAATAVSGILADNRSRLDPLMRDFRSALASMRQQEKQINESIKGLATMARYFANATGNGNYVDVHVPVPVGDNLTCGTGCR